MEHSHIIPTISPLGIHLYSKNVDGTFPYHPNYIPLIGIHFIPQHLRSVACAVILRAPNLLRCDARQSMGWSDAQLLWRAVGSLAWLWPPWPMVGWTSWHMEGRLQASKNSSTPQRSNGITRKHHRVWIPTTGSIDFVATSWGSISSVFIT